VEEKHASNRFFLSKSRPFGQRIGLKSERAKKSGVRILLFISYGARVDSGKSFFMGVERGFFRVG
jgi:hypothetical protein